jgi:hypothetical protein
MHFKTLRKAMYPIEICIDFHVQWDRFVPWLSQDITFVYAVLATNSAYEDLEMQRPPSKMTFDHTRRALASLNQRLAVPDAYSSDTVIWVIMSLLIISCFTKDEETAQTHFSGLQEIVRLRGGFDAIEPKLQFKIDRIDLSWSLTTGTGSQFRTGQVQWSPIFRGLFPSTDVERDYISINGLVDINLADIYRDLQHLVSSINKHMELHATLEGTIFQCAMGSIQSRLCQVELMPKGSLGEGLRVGMLAFLTTMFQIPGRSFYYELLVQQLQATIQAMKTRGAAEEEVYLWLVVIAAVMVPSQGALWPSIAFAGLADPRLAWPDVRPRLKKVMWINCIHDDLGILALVKLSQGLKACVQAGSAGSRSNWDELLVGCSL